jgi:hypothetical protein
LEAEMSKVARIASQERRLHLVIPRSERCVG